MVKHCPNCNAQLQGKFCHNCGQEDSDRHMKFWAFLKHFFSDILHFDTKLVRTVVPLMFKPGFLTQEYFDGRVVRYFDPIRMFLFLTLVYFVIASLMPVPKGWDMKLGPADRKITINDMDTLVLVRTDTLQHAQQAADSTAGERGKFDRWVDAKGLELEKKYGSDVEGFRHDVFAKFDNIHQKLFLLMMPFLAFLFYLFYSKQQYYYVDHAIFSLHFFSFFFLLSTLLSFRNFFSGDTAILILLGSYLLSAFYLYKGMRRIYKQSRRRTFFKLLGIGFIFGLVFGVLMIANLVYSVLGVA